MAHEADYHRGTLTNNKTSGEIEFIYHESVANVVNYVMNGILKVNKDLRFCEIAEYNEVFNALDEDTNVSVHLGKLILNKEGLEGKIKLLKEE